MFNKALFRFGKNLTSQMGFEPITVIFLSFWTDRSGQTVQTQIRLLLEDLIRVYTLCNSLCIFRMHYTKEMPFCSTFRVITINFQVSEILELLR